MNHHIREALLEMGLRRTKALYGRVVTRWTEASFEIGTYGVCILSLDQAVAVLAAGGSPLTMNLTAPTKRC